MDQRFQRAVAALRSGDLEQFKNALAADPALVTARSSQSHPTLLQCVVLDGCGKPNNVDMARLLIDGVELLLSRGADPSIKDAKIGALPAGWAAHAGQTEIVELLAARR